MQVNLAFMYRLVCEFCRIAWIPAFQLRSRWKGRWYDLACAPSRLLCCFHACLCCLGIGIRVNCCFRCYSLLLWSFHFPCLFNFLLVSRNEKELRCSRLIEICVGVRTSTVECIVRHLQRMLIELWVRKTCHDMEDGAMLCWKRQNELVRFNLFS